MVHWQGKSTAGYATMPNVKNDIPILMANVRVELVQPVVSPTNLPVSVLVI